MPGALRISARGRGQGQPPEVSTALSEKWHCETPETLKTRKPYAIISSIIAYFRGILRETGVHYERYDFKRNFQA